MKKYSRKYDAEFKRNAVRLVTEGDKSCREVERDLGLSRGIVYRCVRELKTNSTHCFPGNVNINPSQADVARLVEENSQLRRERDILKKALGVFSRAPHRSTGLLRTTHGQ